MGILDYTQEEIEEEKNKPGYLEFCVKHLYKNDSYTYTNGNAVFLIDCVQYSINHDFLKSLYDEPPFKQDFDYLKLG